MIMALAITMHQRPKKVRLKCTVYMNQANTKIADKSTA